MHIFVLLYADDTVILAENAADMQNSLKVFEEYCSKWKLSLNVDKTKIIIFSRKKLQKHNEFEIYGSNIEIVDSYSYLGLLFNYNGKFTCARKKLTEQAKKALYALYRKIRNMSVPVDLQLRLFDSLVLPVLLYSSEIWGFENIDIIEKVHLQFLKRILNVKSSTPNFMVYGETGRYPLDIHMKLRMLNFWMKLVNNSSKLSGMLYKLLLQLHNDGLCKSKWLSFVQSILDKTGFSYIWENQFTGICFTEINLQIKKILQDQFVQKWRSDISNSSRGIFYSIFKTDFCLENYLLRLVKKRRITISKFRCSNIKFPVETGRWKNIVREKRICTLCNRGIGDEFHYLFLCGNKDIASMRDKYIPEYYVKYSSERKLKGMLSLCNNKVLNNLSIFLTKIVKLL